MKNLLIISLLLILSSCATFIHGTKQKIKVVSNPNGSTIKNNGIPFGTTTDTTVNISELLKNNLSYLHITKAGPKLPKNVISFDILPIVSQAVKNLAIPGEPYQLIKYQISYERYLTEKLSFELSFLKKNAICPDCEYKTVFSKNPFGESNAAKFSEVYQVSLILKKYWKKGFHTDFGLAYRELKAKNAQVIWKEHDTFILHVGDFDFISNVRIKAKDYQIKLLTGYCFLIPAFTKKDFITLDIFGGITPYYRFVDLDHYQLTRYYSEIPYSLKTNESESTSRLILAFQLGFKVGLMF